MARTSDKPFEPTPLGYAILGVLIEEPRSGYAVRMVFEQTAMGQYSSSPGSIYPALKRLSSNGLVVQSSRTAKAGRSSTVFRVTSKGKTTFEHWLQTPIRRADVTHGMKTLLLRFSFMHQQTSSETLSFLLAFEKEVQNYCDALESFLKTQSSELSLVSRLAIENGVTSYKGQKKWAARAIKAILADE